MSRNVVSYYYGVDHRRQTDVEPQMDHRDLGVTRRRWWCRGNDDKSGMMRLGVRMTMMLGCRRGRVVVRLGMVMVMAAAMVSVN